MKNFDKDAYIKQHCIQFAEWCIKNRYIFYFNGEAYVWGNSAKQEYFTSEELYEKYLLVN